METQPFSGLQFAIENQIRLMAAMISVGLLIVKNPPQLPVLFGKQKPDQTWKPNLDVAKEAVDIASQIHEQVSRYQWSLRTQREPAQWPRPENSKSAR